MGRRRAANTAIHDEQHRTKGRRRESMNELEASEIPLRSATRTSQLHSFLVIIIHKRTGLSNASPTSLVVTMGSHSVSTPGSQFAFNDDVSSRPAVGTYRCLKTANISFYVNGDQKTHKKETPRFLNERVRSFRATCSSLSARPLSPTGAMTSAGVSTAHRRAKEATTVGEQNASAHIDSESLTSCRQP